MTTICNTCKGTGIVKGLHDWKGGGTREQKCWNCSPAPQVETLSAAQAGVPADATDCDAVALARYKVVPAHESMFHRFAVVAGDGKQQLYLGREVECENMARKFAGAFLDGAFYQSNIAPTPPAQAADRQPAPDAAHAAIAEADRRAGAAERELAACKEDLSRLERARDQMKAQWGVDRNVSFDVVWSEALALKSAQPAPAPAPSNCMECRNADSWGLPDKSCCRSCVSGSNWEPLNKSSRNPNVPPPAPAQSGQELYIHPSPQTTAPAATVDALDAARWCEHVGKLDALVAYCPTCCQGFPATEEMTRDQIIFECGKTAGRSAAMAANREVKP